MALTDSDIEAVAVRVAELLRSSQATDDLVDAAEIARRLGVSRDFVYAHAAALGGVRLGGGPKARLRFNPAKAGRALGKTPAKAAPPTRRQRKRRSAPLLPVRRSGRK